MPHFSTEFITLKGLIVPSRWDKIGNITGIMIACFDEEEYEVLMDEIGGGLKAFIHKKIEIVGQCAKRNETKTIRVKEYSLND